MRLTRPPAILTALALVAACAGCAESTYRLTPTSSLLRKSDAEAAMIDHIRRVSARDVPAVYDKPIEATYIRLPEYPGPALYARSEGDVVVEFTIDEYGNVKDVVATESPDPVLSRAAIAAVSRWQFKPVMKNGKPIPIRITQVLEFVTR